MKPRIIAQLVALTLVAGVPAGAQDTRSLQITRAENIPSRSGPAENFTGEVRVRPLFDSSAPQKVDGFDKPVRNYEGHGAGKVELAEALESEGGDA